MSVAATALMPMPMLEAPSLAAARRGAVVGLRLAGLVMSGAVLAAGLWLMLAGPGFLSDAPRGHQAARALHRG